MVDIFEQAVSWTDEGMVKRIRGVSFSTRVSSQFEHAMITAARGVFNRLLSDVHIFTDHRTGPHAGKYAFFLLSFFKVLSLIYSFLSFKRGF